jgi:streptogramin lyase
VRRGFVVAAALATLSLTSVAVHAQEEKPASAPSTETAKPARPPRPGVERPGVKRDMAAIKPIAEFPVPGNPDWLAITTDAVWVTSGRKNIVGRLDPKTNAVVALIDVGERPCSGLVAAFGSLWVPICGDKTLARVDLQTNAIVAKIPVGPALNEGGLTANADSVWMLSDMAGVLSRIDPETNRVVAEIQVPSGSSVVVLGEDDAIWVVSTENSVVIRIDPKTNLVTDRVEVGPNPRFTTAGGGSIWTLNQGDGSVSRIDVKSKKLMTDIQLGVPGGGGEIAFGAGYVWVTVFDIPLTQIDPETNRVTKQWFGPGGDAVRVGHGSLWLSNIRQENVWRIDPNLP